MGNIRENTFGGLSYILVWGIFRGSVKSQIQD